MPEKLVICGGLPAPARRAAEDVLELDTSPNAPPGNRLELRLDKLSKQLVDNIDPVLRDAVEIASYVFATDRILKRGTDRIEKMGANWRRDIHFRIPVRKHSVWTASDISKCLHETIGFLSEDQITFEFEAGDPDALLDPYLGFQDTAAHRIKPDDIILFSGGLDSLAGAVQQLIGEERSAVLVTHKSSTNIAARQDALVGELEQRAKQRLFYAPIWVRKGEPVEHTQRTRSFLFVSLAVAIARMFDRDVVHLFENGITSFNLPIAENVVGTRASRTTHPKILMLFANLFSMLVQRTVHIENKYIWYTKRDVVEVLSRHGCADLIKKTTSCAQIRSLAMTGSQCGVCSQCIERQYAMWSAGLEDAEASASYAVDLFTGAHSNPIDITMAEQHLLRAHRFRSMSQHAFLAAYGQVFRTLSALPGTTSENAKKVFDLHQRYGREITEVADHQIRMNAGVESALNLPSTALVVLAGAPSGVELAERDPYESEPPASTQAASDKRPVPDLRFRFAVNDSQKKIVFLDGPELTGANYRFVRELAQQFRADWSAEKNRSSYGYVPTKTLMSKLTLSEHSVGQTAARVRRALRDQFLDAIDYLIDEEDIIQSFRWQGYRLNPFLIMVPASQAECHDSNPNVMTRLDGH